MTLIKSGNWRLGCSETSVKSDLIQNIGKTSQLQSCVKIEKLYLIDNINIKIVRASRTLN